LGNEPDVDPSKVDPDSGYGCWGDASDPYYGGRYYAKMLKKAYPAIRSADSQAKVLTGGLLLGRPTADKDTSPLFLEGILLGGGGPYFDILAFHAYVWYGGSLGEMWNGDWPESPTVMPQKVAFLRGVLSQYGYGDKVLMNTESALFCSDPTADCLETQAIYVARVYAEAIALRLRAQVYFRMINEGWRHTGLLLPDLTPKPVYDAYQASSLFLTGVQSKGVATGYPSGIEGYTFRYNDHSGYVDVLWSADGSVKSVTVPENGVAHDRYAVIIGSAGEVVQVDYSPVYVRRFP
jgi:hypothetical protein